MSIKRTNLGITGVYILTCDQCAQPAPEDFFNYRDIASFQKRTGWSKVKSSQGLQLDICPGCGGDVQPNEAAAEKQSLHSA